MAPTVRPARPDDPAVVELLYLSAEPYYDAFAGSSARARGLLEALYGRPGHTASWEVCRVAQIEGRTVGVVASFPAAQGDRLARRFLRMSFSRLPPWSWPKALRHLKASSRVSPLPPIDALYVDALAVVPDARRLGVARALLRDAEHRARSDGLSGVALDTGLQNTSAQALYEGHGFVRGDDRRAADERSARIIGGPGFVSYFKRV